MAGNKGKYLQEYNYCKKLIENGQYYQLIDFLQTLTLKYSKLKDGYLINAKNGVLNQALVKNIGCFTETNIKEILKHMIKDKTYILICTQKWLILNAIK